jgi:hypothetical protein
MDLYEVMLYKGEIKTFINIASKNFGKTTRKKLFIPFVILNDLDHSRNFFRLLTDDATTGAKTITNIYNILINPKIISYYGNLFKIESLNKQKIDEKKTSFTTITGVSM